MTNDERIAWLREWLRYHGDWSIKLDLWGLYGTIVLEIYHHSELLHIDRGEHLDKRLDEAIRYCKEIERVG